MQYSDVPSSRQIRPGLPVGFFIFPPRSIDRRDSQRVLRYKSAHSSFARSTTSPFFPELSSPREYPATLGRLIPVFYLICVAMWRGSRLCDFVAARFSPQERNAVAVFGAWVSFPAWRASEYCPPPLCDISFVILFPFSGISAPLP